jgi:hypothetical protein
LGPRLFAVECHCIGQILLKQLGGLVWWREPVQAIPVDGPEEHAKTFNFVEKLTPRGGGGLEEPVKHDV